MYERLEFRIPNENDIEQIQNNFTRCDWKDDLINDIQEHYVDTYRVLLSQNEILGFANVYYTGHDILGLNIYIVSVECTKDKLTNNTLTNNTQTNNTLTNNTQQTEFITNGRLLWSYILKNIYELNGNKQFIIYNHAIPDAFEYHIKMGMYPSKKYGSIFDENIKHMFLENEDLNNAELSEPAINSDEFSFLFILNIFRAFS